LVKRGEVHMTLKEYTEAIRDFSEASQLDAASFNIKIKLQEALRASKNVKKKDYYKILGI